MPDYWVQEIWLQRQRFSVKCRIVQALINRGYDMFEFEAMLIEIEEQVYRLLAHKPDQIRYISFRLDEIHDELMGFLLANSLRDGEQIRAQERGWE